MCYPSIDFLYPDTKSKNLMKNSLNSWVDCLPNSNAYLLIRSSVCMSFYPNSLSQVTYSICCNSCSQLVLLVRNLSRSMWSLNQPLRTNYWSHTVCRIDCTNYVLRFCEVLSRKNSKFSAVLPSMPLTSGQTACSTIPANRGDATPRRPNETNTLDMSAMNCCVFIQSLY